jgi:D-alanyl-lipoteichoic acid acyltransferase DltB (MBOAT superfamily)
MLFHTWIFVVFFLIVYPVHLLVRKTPFMVPWLLLASYVFYGWWNPLYLALIIYATAVNYAAVALMDRTGHKKLWLAVSVVNSLGLLGFFKYAGFVTDNVNLVLSHLGASYRIPAPGVLLPVGISFFTFQAMSYTIDYYRGQVPRERSLIRFATYVALFPQLVAGPIERSTNLLPQLHRPPTITREDITDGLSLLIVGLFKKVALADYLGLYTDKVFNAPAQFQAPALILASFAFGWQIYFDFSGYTDMARGIARTMGFRLMLNFNNPYLATDLGDFWRRWHISLSTWFKDYVYIPLGGNRGGKLNTYKNMVLTMLISGLWHGAAWTFVIWGALHAAGRVVTRELERAPFYRDKVPKLAKQMGVFAFVTFAWIFFRARTLHDASTIVTRIFTTGWADPAFPVVALGLVLAVWVYEHVYESRHRWALALAPARVAIVVTMGLYLAVFAGSSSQPFIYFQF